MLVFTDAGCYKTAIKQYNENYVTVATYTLTTAVSSWVITTFGFIHGYVVHRLANYITIYKEQ